jgi:hypothetical protein
LYQSAPGWQSGVDNLIMIPVIKFVDIETPRIKSSLLLYNTGLLIIRKPIFPSTAL